MTDLILSSSHLAPSEQQATTNPYVAYIASQQSDKSQRTMRQQLTALASMIGYDDPLLVPWHHLRVEHTQAIWAKLASDVTASTANLRLSALRGILKMCWRMQLMPSDDYQRAIDLKAVKGNRLDAAAGRSLTLAELRALFRVCAEDESLYGRRDAAILALMYGAGGLRRSEVVALNLSDFDERDGKLVIRGKGNKTRTAYVRGGARDALDDWLAVRGGADGPLFWRLQAGGSAGNLHERLTDQAIYGICQARGTHAQIKAFTPHDVRRTYISDQLDAGTDVITVARLAGHADPKTTSRYDRRGERAKQSAADALHVPYIRKES